MSLSGITGATPDIAFTRIDSQVLPGNARRDTPAGQTATTPAPTTTARPAANRAAGRALPPDAPEGTDPDLWSILTSEERSFFARTSGAGPLTYAKVMRPDRHNTPAVATARGGRVDVRV